MYQIIDKVRAGSRERRTVVWRSFHSPSREGTQILLPTSHHVKPQSLVKSTYKVLLLLSSFAGEIIRPSISPIRYVSFPILRPAPSSNVLPGPSSRYPYDFDQTQVTPSAPQRYAHHCRGAAKTLPVCPQSQGRMTYHLPSLSASLAGPASVRLSTSIVLL